MFVRNGESCDSSDNHLLLHGKMVIKMVYLRQGWNEFSMSQKCEARQHTYLWTNKTDIRFGQRINTVDIYWSETVFCTFQPHLCHVFNVRTCSSTERSTIGTRLVNWVTIANTLLYITIPMYRHHCYVFISNDCNVSPAFAGLSLFIFYECACVPLMPSKCFFFSSLLFLCRLWTFSFPITLFWQLIAVIAFVCACLWLPFLFILEWQWKIAFEHFNKRIYCLSHWHLCRYKSFGLLSMGSKFQFVFSSLSLFLYYSHSLICLDTLA